jgi:hypothetical protein
MTYRSPRNVKMGKIGKMRKRKNKYEWIKKEERFKQG